MSDRGCVNIMFPGTFITLAAHQRKLAPCQVRPCDATFRATRMRQRDKNATSVTGRSRARTKCDSFFYPTSLADSSFFASSSTLQLRQKLLKNNEIGSKMIVNMSRIDYLQQNIVSLLEYIFCALKRKKFQLIPKKLLNAKTWASL